LLCEGYSGLLISLSSSYSSISSFGVPVGQGIQLYTLAKYSNGTVYAFTDSATWSSSNTAVATVSGGLVTGVAGGSSQITASISLVAPGEKALGCGGCPGQQPMAAGATADVCDFSVGGGPPKPTCNGSQQTVTYTAVPTCSVKSPPSSCNASLQMNSGYQGELGTVTPGTDPTTHNPTCTVTYFVGPAQGSYKSGTDVGELSLSFTVNFSSAPKQTANQSQQVVCQ
jgi:Bacterial Ig-like domain (group 2)